MSLFFEANMLHIDGARLAMLIFRVCTHKGGLEASLPLEVFKPVFPELLLDIIIKSLEFGIFPTTGNMAQSSLYPKW